MKRTKIVCTIGPASDSKAMLEKLIKSGMNCARLNFSHNVQSYHLKVLNNVRKLSKKLKNPVAIIQDLQGPRIRLGNLPAEGIILKKNDKVILTTALKNIGKKIPVTYEDMHRDVKAGQPILIADGLMELEVLKVKGRDIYCLVVTGGKITSHKGINLPETLVRASSISEKDREDLLFGVKNAVDFVAVSFVRSAADVHELRTLIEQYKKKLHIKTGSHIPEIKIIVKIERREAIDNIEEIIEATDALMVARGDLGVELPSEEVPILQKMIIDKCLAAAKPVIVATQMLESMINNPRPTRAEVSDVANAVIDHTDAVMLSGETAAGKYPAEAVQIMARILEKTESSVYDNLTMKQYLKKMLPVNEAISRMAKMLSQNIDVKAIVVGSLSGRSARLLSRYRPELPIVVSTTTARVRNQLNLSWGVLPVLIPVCDSFEKLIKYSLKHLKVAKLAKRGEKILLIAGEPVGKSEEMNLIEVKTVGG